MACSPQGLLRTNSWEEVYRQGEAANYQGRYQDAERYFLQALKLAQDFGADDLRLPKTLNSLGGLAGRYEKHHVAQQHFEQALIIYHRVLGPQSVEVGETENLLGRVLSDQGRLKESEAHYMRALQILSSAYGREDDGWDPCF